VAPETDPAIIMSLETVSAVFFGWLLLGETLTLQQLSGCVLMLMGMLMAQASVFSLSHGQPSQGKPLLPHPPAASPQTEREREQPLV